jgi:arylsulfatase A-like enzyme
MKKSLSLLLAGFFCFCVVGGATPPNILLILADDLGYADLSAQGCKQFQTPNIDSIATNGVRFTDGYVTNSVCAPSRAGIMSGRIDIGFEANIPEDPNPNTGLDANLKTMADMLKGAGYSTFCIGKWHLGADPQFYPTQRGFDYFCGLRAGSRSYFPNAAHDASNSPRRIEMNGRDVQFEGYLTDYFTDRAVELIESHAEKSPDKPFFMYLSYTAPHAPMEARPELSAKFTHIENEKRRIYAAMVTSLDQGVGRVLDSLKKNNLLENTLVVFLSDNGGPIAANGSSNGPLKGQKGSLWEGGVRVPFLIQWTAKIPAGQVRADVVSSLDLVPTFAAIAGTQPLDKATGINLIPHLESGGKKVGDRKLFWRRAKMQLCALRSGSFKWSEERKKGERSVFDLGKDIGEKTNLVTQMPELSEQLKQEYEQWERTVPEPAFDEKWDEKKEKQQQREQQEYERTK